MKINKLLEINDCHKRNPTILELTKNHVENNKIIYLSLKGLIEDYDERTDLTEMIFQINKENADIIIKILQEHFNI
jgi:hypothetical protein